MLNKVESGDISLKKGDRDSSTNGAVSEMQKLLEDNGFSLPSFGIDGIFEDETEGAVNDFRRSKGLAPNGIFDSQAIGGSGASGGIRNWLRNQVVRKIDNGPRQKQTGMNYAGIDLDALSNETGIEPAFLMAILKQESGGNPAAIRFEPHLFNRKSRASNMPFTPGKGKSFSLVRSETDRGAFERAFQKDPDAAVRSTSWGLGQVLGSHLINLYGSPEKGVKSFFSNPKEVSLRLIVEWIKANPRAVSAARNLNFKGFARIYNGSNYRMNNYDKKIENEYNLALMELK